MTRLSALALLVMLSAPAMADVRHDWYAARDADGHAYAYDLASIDNAYGVSVKSVAIYVDAMNGGTEVLFFIDCATGRGAAYGSISDTNMLMTESDANPARYAWDVIPQTGPLKIAADVACLRHVIGSVHADNQQAALDKLKQISN